MNRGAHYYHEALYSELIRYLKSQYLGKSEVLLEACDALLKRPGQLYSEPFIESSPAYKTVHDGIARSGLPAYIIAFFEALIDARLGVYRAPFQHQIEALQNAWNGKDLLVSTGTGSGKTECFMWPLIAKMVREAKASPNTWVQRGIRTIILYPMNALVSDQVGRLRRLLGDPEGKFLHAFHNTCGLTARRPQFGMYTGRTPYAGREHLEDQDVRLAKALSRILPRDANDAYYQHLLKNGKIPAKKDLSAYIDQIHRGVHETDAEDAEMLTRFEMQKECPDILITNYSMLELMLFRPLETSLWVCTKDWLDRNPQEKLLIVVDEAHMYRGSSGGEVALLLRRLFYKLGISRDRVQFILTTASMPHETEKERAAVARFAQALTASVDESFVPLWGCQERLIVDSPQDIPADALRQVDIERLDANEITRLSELNVFRNRVAPTESMWMDPLAAYQWLYDHLKGYRPFQMLFSACRGEAISLSDLAQQIFPEESQERALSAVDAMLTIAPMARDASGSVLFPARMHMLFRGLRGIYACSNPDCPHGHRKGGLSLGHVELSNTHATCPACHSRVYELYNDRRCGALFFRGYVESNTGSQFLWTNPGAFFDAEKMKEIHLYLPLESDTLPKYKKGTKQPKRCYLDYESGYISFDDSAARSAGFRPLWFSTFTAKGNPDILTFSICPKCESRLSNTRLTSFSTRGNEAFYNVTREQFLQQPPARLSDEEEKRFPNQGRKVLLFSDSRQQAAVLARDMSLASDGMAVRQLFLLALKRMHATEERTGDERTLHDVYGFFVQAAVEQNVSLFSAESMETFERHKNSIRSRMRQKGNGDSVIPPRSLNFNSAPPEMQEHLLRLFCTRYNTLSDAGLCYLAPTLDDLYEAMEKLKTAGIEVSETNFLECFYALLRVFLTEHVALGHQIIGERRRAVRREYETFGYADFIQMPTAIAACLDITDKPDQQVAWMDAFRVFCDHGLQNQRYYLNLERLRPVFDQEHTWYRCSRCASVLPSMLNVHCPACGRREIYEIADFSPEAFWRDNALIAVNGGAVRVIDTEEHTAQLGYKDQRNEMWAKTEQYEMRFQDMVDEDETPVDILSSTTTMEVGIDIGSLVAVGLRNVPPMRENYQQRAGRAGRRGSSMSTIITFAEGGPHDAHYFRHPVPMLRGKPREPWIDTDNEKLLNRHLCMVALNTYLPQHGHSMDELPAIHFVESHLADFERFLSMFQIPSHLLAILLPESFQALKQAFKKKFLDEIQRLSEKIEAHPDAYGSGMEEKKQKPLLDALYEEGIIPTYSFPKDVVRLHIENERGEILYQPERGLDVAISEYAPGRTIVLDKRTYQVGGIYLHTKHTNPFEPAKQYFNDTSRHFKEMKRCEHCDWFGFTSELLRSRCPFCSNEQLVDTPPMLRPWGFSPINGEAISPTAVDARYSSAGTPSYSTQHSDVMLRVPSCVNMRFANRPDQTIIMLNEGSKTNDKREGFMVCSKCGAAAPGDDPSVLGKIQRPGNGRATLCKHTPQNVYLGYSFLTDMFVAEIALPKTRLETETKDAILWRRRAATTLAEALRLSASRMLDVEFADIQAGYRLRSTDSSLFLDLYLYDSLSSGAGYSSRIGLSPEALLDDTAMLLSSCTCDRACEECLKHYRNQHIQSHLDRRAALQLLAWARRSEIPARPIIADIEDAFRSMERLLQVEGISWIIDRKRKKTLLSHGTKSKECIVHAAMERVQREPNQIVVTIEALADAKPFAIGAIKEAFGI